MQVFTLSSGSTGNCTLIADGDTSVLIDAGISAKRIVTALEELGFSFDRLSGILITHEHSDHISGLTTLIKHHTVPILAPRTIANHLRYCIAGVEDYIKELPVGEESRVGCLEVVPFHTPHDTPESVGYRLSGSALFGFCTDCGHITGEVLEGLHGVNGAVIEANHDLDMLKNGPYPIQLKRRILSDNGHLSNDSCASLALELMKNGASSIALGHLSRENNTPAAARQTVSAALLHEGIVPGRDMQLSVAPEREVLSLRLGADVKC